LEVPREAVVEDAFLILQSLRVGVPGLVGVEAGLISSDDFLAQSFMSNPFTVRLCKKEERKKREETQPSPMGIGPMVASISIQFCPA